MLLSIPLLFMTIWYFGSVLIRGEVEGVIRTINIFIFLFFICVFTYYIIFIILKKGKDFNNIKKTTPFNKIFGISFSIYMVYYGLVEMFVYNNFNNFYIILIGIGIFINNYWGLK